MGVLIILLLLVAAPLCQLWSAVAGRASCIERERRALLDIRAGLHRTGDQWLSSWSDDDGDCCKWRGVGCNNATGHVVKLSLQYDQYLSATQPPSKLNPSLAELTHLQHLDLSFNNFNYTPIPDFIGSLVQLTHLNLSFTNFGGSVPPHLGNLSRLRFLDLHGEIEYTYSTKLYMFNYTLSSGNLHWLSQMSSLQYVDLSAVDLSLATGWLQDITMLSSLSELRLRNAKLHSLPAFLPHHLNLTSLTTLDLSGSSFLFTTNATTLPHWLFNVTSLQRLDLSYCGLSGKIPTSIQNLGGLTYLDLGGNMMIRGELPESLGNLQKLQYLDLSNNSISGEIPLSMGKLCNLKNLLLSNNNIGGEISWLIDGWSKCTQKNRQLTNASSEPSGDDVSGFGLRQLSLEHNKLKGSVPQSLRHLSQLISLGLSSNSFNGTFPEATPPRLQFLLLNSNNFTGPMPKLGPSIDIADLSNNSFSGPIPRDLGATGLGLQMLSISDNHLSGSIPYSICNFNNLEVLHLSNNNLSGRFPKCHSKRFIKSKEVNSTEFFTSLQSLNLRNNGITGGFPLVLKHCGNLTLLDLSGNQLSGEIPAWKGENMKSLKVFILRSNNFSGSVPPRLSALASLQVLDLSHNRLSGRLPPFFWNFTAMRTDTNISQSTPYSNISRYYSESIFVNTKGLITEYTKLLTIVTSVDISANYFSGEISDGLVNLYGLRSLNMSANHFKGKIPENIGYLQLLESLDLSGNDLTGQIPASISTMYFLSHLNLSNNNLSGRIPSGNQLQTFDDPSIYNGNLYLCGWPLPQCHLVEIPSQEQLHRSIDDDKERNEYRVEIIWICVSSIVGFIIGFWSLALTMMLKLHIRIAYFQYIDSVYDWCYVKVAMKLKGLKSIVTKIE